MRRQFEQLAAKVAKDSGVAKVWANVFKDFMDVPAKDWQMSTGFQERLAQEEK